MFARVTTIQINPDYLDDALHIYHEVVDPARKSLEGAQEGYLLVDSIIGKVVVITFWDSREAALVSEKNEYYVEQRRKFKKYFISEINSQGYEVSI